MLVFELSRTSQLLPAGAEIVEREAKSFGVSVESLATEIRTRIDAMPVDARNEAVSWYYQANEFAAELAETYGYSIEICAAVISAVSPRMPWLRNKKVAEEILDRAASLDHLSVNDAAKELGLSLSANVAMALKIVRGADIGETLTGVKRRNFFNNIVSPNMGDSVTVDTWMINAAMHVSGKSKDDAQKFVRKSAKALAGTGVGYFVIAESVRAAAKKLGFLPSETQAMYWVAVSGAFNGGRTYIG